MKYIVYYSDDQSLAEFKQINSALLERFERDSIDVIYARQGVDGGIQIATTPPEE